MVPWNKLPKDLQKAILAMIIMGKQPGEVTEKEIEELHS